VTAAPPDIAEFIRARLDEIDPLRGRLSDNLPHHPYCAGMTVGDDDEYEFRGDLCDCGWPSRVLAECAFKRGLVERFVETAPPYADARQQEIHETLRDEVIEPMAQLWSDHPDPSWRV
jgi:hypothetical protein